MLSSKQSVFHHKYEKRSRDYDSGGWKRYKTSVESDGNVTSKL